MKWWVSGLLLLIFAPSALALTLTFSAVPAAVSYDQEFAVNVVMDCSGCKDSYLRGVFYKSGTNYFGLTQNNSGNWIATSNDKTQYFHVDTASFSGQLKVKPDPADSKYQGPGEYQFKIGRYTSSNSGATWADPVAVNVTGPALPSPTSTLTPTRTVVPSVAGGPTPTPKATSTPIPTPVMTKALPTPINPPSLIPSLSPQVNVGSEERVVANLDSSPSPSPLVLGAETTSPNWLALGVIGAGIAAVMIALFLIWRRQSQIATME